MKDEATLKERYTALTKKIKKAEQTSQRRKEKIDELKNKLAEQSAVITELEKKLGAKRGEATASIRTEKEIAREEYLKLIQRLADKIGFGAHNKGNKEAFDRGDLYYDEGCPMFDPDTLLININPRTGRVLDEEDHRFLLTIFGGDKALPREANENHGIIIEGATSYWYWKAMDEYKEWKLNHPDSDAIGITEWTYNKGMEILPKYIDIIF